MITIIAVSDSHAHFHEAISEYTKRLGKSCDLVLVKSEKSTDAAKIITSETERIIRALEKAKWVKVLLDDSGKNLSTEELCEQINLWQMHESGAVFIIGGAYGVDRKKLTPHLRASLSLWKMTLPHSLALLVLLEQIYRCSQIAKGSGYHHGK